MPAGELRSLLLTHSLNKEKPLLRFSLLSSTGNSCRIACFISFSIGNFLREPDKKQSSLLFIPTPLPSSHCRLLKSNLCSCCFQVALNSSASAFFIPSLSIEGAASQGPLPLSKPRARTSFTTLITAIFVSPEAVALRRMSLFLCACCWLLGGCCVADTPNFPQAPSRGS